MTDFVKRFIRKTFLRGLSLFYLANNLVFIDIEIQTTKNRMKVRNLGRQADHSKDGQMKPDRGNSLACRKIQRRNIPRNIYLCVCS